MGKREAWNTILVFCILTFGFTAATIIKPSDDFSETENRSLAQMPKLTGKNILDGTFESDYESYLTDQFILRDAWIGLKTDVERLAMKKESKDIYFADDDYLIEKHTGSFTTTQAERNIQSLAQFFDMYQDTFPKEHRSVLLIPNAVDILRDKLPPFAAPYDEEDYLAKAKAALAEDLWVDAGSVLRQHTDTQLYYRTDHHWTTFGAYVAYTALAEPLGFEAKGLDFFTQERVSANFRGTVWSTSGMKWVPGEEMYYFRYAGDMDYTTAVADGASFAGFYDRSYLETKDQYGSFLSGNKGYVSVRRNDGGEDRQKLLVIKDSFAHSLVPFLAIHYDLDILDLRYYKSIPAALLKSEEYAGILFLANLEYMTDSPESTKLALMTVGIGD